MSRKAYLYKDGNYFTVIDVATGQIIDPIGNCDEVVLQNCYPMGSVFYGEVIPSEMVPRNGWRDVYYCEQLLDDDTGETLHPRFLEVTPDCLRALE